MKKLKDMLLDNGFRLVKSYPALNYDGYDGIRYIYKKSEIVIRLLASEKGRLVSYNTHLLYKDLMCKQIEECLANTIYRRN